MMPSNMTTEPPEMVFCPPFRDVYVGTLDTSLPYFFDASLNAGLVVPTILGNLVVLLAMRRVTSLRLPSKLLLCSLVLTDLGAGLVILPQHAAFLFLRGSNPGLAPCSLYFSLMFCASMFSCASLLTLTAISLDRYAALFYHLTYNETVTTERVRACLAVLWLASLFCASTTLWKFPLWSDIIVATIQSHRFSRHL